MNSGFSCPVVSAHELVLSTNAQNGSFGHFRAQLHNVSKIATAEVSFGGKILIFSVDFERVHIVGCW